jgi:hypothetical protein
VCDCVVVDADVRGHKRGGGCVAVWLLMWGVKRGELGQGVCVRVIPWVGPLRQAPVRSRLCRLLFTPKDTTPTPYMPIHLLVFNH